jgi:amino acid transporter
LSFAGPVGLNGAVPPPATYPLAAGRLGASALVFFALAAAAPIIVVTTVLPSAYAGADAIVVPLAFLLLGVILLLFSVGYAAMARRAPTTGALYSFIARGLGRPIGVGAAWLALLSYNTVQIGLYGAAGAAAAPLLDLWFGVSADWWMVAAGCWAVVALCGLLRVDLTGGLLAVVVLAEAAVITGFAAANLLEPGGGAITWRTVVPTDWAGIDRPALGLLLVAAAFAFVGFETAAAYGEEVRRPRRSITRATALAVGLTTLLYAVPAWAMSIGAGPGRISGLSAGRGSELTFDLAGARLAPWAVTLGRVLVLTGLVAAMISLHSTIARYVYALARERLLPAGLGRTSARGAVPVGGSVTQSVVAAAALGGVYAAGWDPLTQTFPWLTTAGALGVLLLLLAASLAALLFLNRAPNDETAWQRFVAPGLATVLIGTLCYLAFEHLGELLGVPSGAPLLIVVPGAFVVAVLFGVAYGTALRALGPIVYAGIGLGGSAVVVAPAIPQPRQPGAHRPERIDR